MSFHYENKQNFVKQRNNEKKFLDKKKTIMEIMRKINNFSFNYEKERVWWERNQIM